MNTKMQSVHQKSFTKAGIAALAIAISAGTAMAANPHMSPEHKDTKKHVHDATAWLHLVPASTLMGTEVIGSDNNKVGTINDFVIDRGTGRIAYAIIGHGGILTLGQEVFAVQYNRLNYAPVDESFKVNMTKEQANDQEEFLPENWSDLNHSDWMTELEEFVSGEGDYRYGDEVLTNQTTETVKGIISKITRLEVNTNEEVTLTIERTTGKTAKVTLGPSWYVMGSNNAPSVNDRVDIEAFEYDDRLIATKATIAGQELKLRDTNGNVYWDSPSNKSPRFVMLSDLTSKNIEIGGTTGGEVDDTIIETTSGRVAFFAFDPNDNLFGLADEISLVPWSAIQIANDMTLWSDLESKQFENAYPMPENLGNMRTQRDISPAYSRFDLKTPVFEASNDDDSLCVHHTESED